MLEYGLPPARPGVGIELGGLAQVLDYPARDMTITVTGSVDDGKVDVEKITINDGGAKKSYKQLSDVPEKHRETVKRLISNTDKGPVQFRFEKREN